MSSAAKILVVDDDAAMRTIMSLSLKIQGYTLLTAASGEEALRQSREHPDIRVIILDVVMSGLAGKELAAELQNNLPGAAILFCSGHPASALTRYGIDANATNFLQKPCRAPQLQHMIEQLIATGRGD